MTERTNYSFTLDEWESTAPEVFDDPEGAAEVMAKLNELRDFAASKNLPFFGAVFSGQTLQGTDVEISVFTGPMERAPVELFMMQSVPEACGNHLELLASWSIYREANRRRHVNSCVDCQGGKKH